jgi:hypothetical protein
MHGSGLWTHPDGDEYQGQHRFDQFQGQGMHTWADWGKYIDNFREDKQNGIGIEVDANGEETMGELKHGELVRWID